MSKEVKILERRGRKGKGKLLERWWFF